MPRVGVQGLFHSIPGLIMLLTVFPLTTIEPTYPTCYFETSEEKKKAIEPQALSCSLVSLMTPSISEILFPAGFSKFLAAKEGERLTLAPYLCVTRYLSITPLSGNGTNSGQNPFRNSFPQ